MSAPTPPGWTGQITPMDEIVISRVLSPPEATARARATQRAGMWPMLGYVLGGTWLAMAPFTLLLGRGSLLALTILTLFYLLAIGLALAIALPITRATTAAQARHEIGFSGVLTAVWNANGVRILAENLSRTVWYPDIRSVRTISGFLVLRLRLTLSPTASYLITLPPDFVPPEAAARIRANGVRWHS